MTGAAGWSGCDVLSRALEVLQAAGSAGSAEAAYAAAREELEVLPRDHLVRVASVMAVEAMRVIPPRVDRRRLVERVERRRLHLMFGGPSDG